MLITSRNHSSIKDQPKKAVGRGITELQSCMNELTTVSKRLKHHAQDPRKFMSSRNMLRNETKLEKIDAELVRLADEIKMLQGRIA